MRILFLSNFYPPASRGGYEEWCQEVAVHLRARGHDVLVLTSTFGAENASDPAWVRRKLRLEMEINSSRNTFNFFLNRTKREAENLNTLRSTLNEFKPDVILIWGMWNLPRSLPLLAESLMPSKVAYYMGDYWHTLPNQFKPFWESPATSAPAKIIKTILKPLALFILAREKRPAPQFAHVIFPSQFMQEDFIRKGATAKNTAVVYGAVDTRPYEYRTQVRQSDEISLLYVGRLTEEKGIHTAVEALGRLVKEGDAKIKLKIVGGGEPEYENHLQALARAQGVEPQIEWIGSQPKETLPAFYRHADVFLFTSIWQEPFGRVIVEAMASGVAVVGTAVGGAAEILEENINALVFAPGNAADLADKLRQLLRSPQLRQRLQDAARKTATEKFDIAHMTSGIEAYLKTLA